MPLGGKRKLSEQAGEALTQSRSNQIELNWLRRQVTRQQQLLQAQWKLIKARLVLADSDLVEALAEIEQEARNRPKIAELCPGCGRSLQGDHPQCIYCGQEVKRRDVF
jgi:hypothetical protein